MASPSEKDGGKPASCSPSVRAESEPAWCNFKRRKFDFDDYSTSGSQGRKFDVLRGVGFRDRSQRDVDLELGRSAVPATPSPRWIPGWRRARRRCSRGVWR